MPSRPSQTTSQPNPIGNQRSRIINLRVVLSVMPAMMSLLVVDTDIKEVNWSRLETG